MSSSSHLIAALAAQLWRMNKKLIKQNLFVQLVLLSYSQELSQEAVENIGVVRVECLYPHRRRLFVLNINL
jgi:hypothetical protein